jgi:hypothetical protein
MKAMCTCIGIIVLGTIGLGLVLILGIIGMDEV